ncbi:MAG: hypothetical protein R3F29_05255 [Planctomycetota bacterium]
MDHAPGATHEAVPLDPENDIDARSATLWVVLGAIVLFISLWLMVPMFTIIQHKELMRKVELAPTEERDNVFASEEEFLGGDNPAKKKIDDVLQSLRKK